MQMIERLAAAFLPISALLLSGQATLAQDTSKPGSGTETVKKKAKKNTGTDSDSGKRGGKAGPPKK